MELKSPLRRITLKLRTKPNNRKTRDSRNGITAK